MPGEPRKKYMNEAHERAMTAPINPKVKDKEPDLDLEKRAREAGL